MSFGNAAIAPSSDLRYAARTLRKKLTLRRWYGFLRMQGKVARQARKILTVSHSSFRDIVTDFGVDPERIQVVPLGADHEFVPPTTPRVPGRILAMASADAPMKGIATLLEAFAKLRTERDLELRGPGDFFGTRQSGLPTLRLPVVRSTRGVLAFNAHA